MADRFLSATPPPLTDQVVHPGTGRMSDVWRQWFGRMPATLEAIPSLVNRVNLTDRPASITATNFTGVSLLAGAYRASYRIQITRAATVSSSLRVTFGWTDGGVAQSAVGALITGNTVTTGQSDTIVVRVDKGTNVTYAVTYASAGATSMKYAFSCSLEKVQV